MAGFDVGTFGGGFLQAFTQAQQSARDRKEQEEERKLKTKLFEIQLKREEASAAQLQQQAQAREQLLSQFGNQAAPTGEPSGIPGAQGPVAAPAGSTPSLTEMLADPKNAMLFLRSGLGNLGDITSMQGQARNQQLLERVMGGGGGGQGGAPPGMELSAIKLDPTGRPMLDFERPQVWQEVPAPDGMSKILLDRQGREIGRRPVSPGEKPQPTEEDKRQRDVAAVLKTYEQAKEGLLKGLEGTATGPLLGRLPAITSAQQTAKGSVAAMAPVLKQLFRAAGEGVFTDRDQQLLIDMIPDRETNPEARASMVANIDAIVRAKLGLDSAGSAPDTSGSRVIDFSQLPQ